MTKKKSQSIRDRFLAAYGLYFHDATCLGGYHCEDRESLPPKKEEAELLWNELIRANLTVVNRGSVVLPLSDADDMAWQFHELSKNAVTEHESKMYANMAKSLDKAMKAAR